MTILVRPATRTDVAALGRLGAEMVRTHHAFDAKRFIAPTSGTEAGYGNFLGSQLDERNTFVFVAEQDGRVVGYSYAGVEGMDYMALRGPAGVLYDIVVEPAQRGKGIGRRLLDATLAELGQRRVERVVLSTADRNEAAQRLFERAGFRRTMIEMTRELDGN